MKTSRRGMILVGLAAAAGLGLWWNAQRGQGAARARVLYASPLDPPEGGLSVYHLGHSLVGRDMPAMLAQLAGHDYRSQLGWGASLRAHWDPDVPVNGFDTENAHDRFAPARETIAAGGVDALVLTEMVEIKDAVRYEDSARHLAQWATLAHQANPATRIYLYESWHHTDDPAGWLARIDNDLPAQWIGRILHPALGRTEAPIHLIPAGQVMAAFVRAVQAAGGVEGVGQVQDLFATTPEGAPDTIHFNDLGAYLVALTHYAVLYHRSPVGLPHALMRADGTPAQAPSAAAAARMQQTVWEVVTRHPETGVAP